MSKRRVAGEIVYKQKGAGFCGQGSFVMLEAEDDREPCVMGCGDPDCTGWSNCRRYGDDLRPTDVWFYHVYECQMHDVFDPEEEQAMSDDGFRVGRRVRVNLPNDPFHGREGRLVPRRGDPPGAAFWNIDFDGTGPDRIHSFFVDCLELLPDEPATPEPERPSLTETFRELREHAGDLWDGVDAIKYVEEVRNGREPQPAPEHPDHYAVLRDAGHEPWAVMAACYSRDWRIGYNVLTALAYLMRCQLKHDTPDDDICKAAAHLAEARAIIEGREAA